MHVRLETPIRYTVALHFAWADFLAETSHHPLAHLAGFAHGAAAHRWRCREVADQLRDRMRQRIIHGSDGRRHRRRCTSCERAMSEYENRPCKLCSTYHALLGIDPDYTGGESTFAATELSQPDAEAYEDAQLGDGEIDLGAELARGDLVINPLRLRICQAYVEQKGNVSAVARIVKRDRKVVYHHLERYRDRLDALLRDGASLPRTRSEPTELLTTNTVIFGRAELYAFSSERDGNGKHKRIPKPADAFDVKCTSCGVGNRHCVSVKKSHCCEECWHPQTMRVKETRFNTSRG